LAIRFGRSLPPAAAPIRARECIWGICGIFRGHRELDRFQSELKEYFGVKHCFLVSSGKAAFALILLALKELFPDRDEVLIPAFTCYSVPASISRAGLRIRLCDLHPDSLDFDFAQMSSMLSGGTGPLQEASSIDGATASPVPPLRVVENPGKLGNRILAVVPTHLFGIPADVPRLRKMVQDLGITVVEDAAQAMGETWQGGKLGTFGDVSFFSLGRGKALSSVEGGVIITDRDDIAEAIHGLIKPLPQYGWWGQAGLIVKALGMMLFTHPSLYWVPLSLPFLKLGQTLFEPHFPILKMSSFQAGLAKNWRERLAQSRDGRKKTVDRWIAILEARRIRGSHFVNAQSLGLLRFPLRVSDKAKRGALLRESAWMGLGIMSVYPASINAIPELQRTFKGRAFAVAESRARELVTLPTHGYLTEDDVAAICRLMSRVLA